VFDAAIALDAPTPALRAQIDRACRAAAARDEFTARRTTAERLRLKAVRAGPERAFRMLFIGPPHALYLDIDAWIRDRRGAVSAAFSSFSGLDHLHDEAFDAVVVNGAGDLATGLAICAALRRNALTQALPAMLLAAGVKPETIALATEKGASVVCDTTAGGGDLAGALAWLRDAIRLERSHANAERGLAALKERMGDGRTGLFSERAFLAHLDTVAERHAETGRPLTLAALQMAPAFGAAAPAPAALERAVCEGASLAARLIRSTDFGCLIRDTAFLALPYTAHAEARRAMERIAAVADCTAFVTSDGGPGPLCFAQSFATQGPGENGGALFARLLETVNEEGLRA
jgi:two-component system cell cycle response regulator PopA